MKSIKNLATAGALIGLTFCSIACDNAKETMTKDIEAVKKGAVAAEKMAEKTFEQAKEEYTKFSHEHLESFEQKIKDLSGDALAEAKTLYEGLKEKVEAMKEAAPEKFAELKAEISDKIAELKTKLGL